MSISWGSSIWAQGESGYTKVMYQQFPYKGSSDIKLNFIGGNVQELAIGLGYQYYIKNTMSVQINLDYLTVGNGFNIEFHKNIKGHGIRLMPEFRYYLTRRKKIQNVDLYFALVGMMKYNQVKIDRWTYRSFDPNNAGAPQTDPQHRKYESYVNSVFAFGVMPQLGLQGYMGKEKIWSIDGSLAIGLARNYIKTQSHLPLYSDPKSGGNAYGVVSNNEYEGRYPYLNFRLAVGYRLVR